MAKGMHSPISNAELFVRKPAQAGAGLGERVVAGGKERVPVFELVDEDADDQFTYPGLR